MTAVIVVDATQLVWPIIGLIGIALIIAMCGLLTRRDTDTTWPIHHTDDQPTTTKEHE